MAKLKNIIKQLTEIDFKSIYDSLMESNADKSAYLLKSMREKQLADLKIMNELGVNTNAYYTLRSRLKQKIEEYLLQQMENPRTDILKKVANIVEILFTKKKAIAIATLKKLEKELIDYDLSNELTIIYKSLKKLHLHSPDYFHYSQQYNKHIAYMLAVDKAEDLLAEYFKRYGNYVMSNDEMDKMGLEMMIKEMNNLCNLYDSHRLYVYQSCISIYHRLFVSENETEDDAEPIEDIIEKVEAILDQYNLDSIYYHLSLIFEFIKLEYYEHYNVHRKAEKFFAEINTNATTLLSNYSLFTYPAQFLTTKIKRAIRLGQEEKLNEENIELFADFDPDTEDVPKFITYSTYRAISCYYAGEYKEASKWLSNLLNQVSIKKMPLALLEVKVLLVLQYCLMNDFDLFNQLMNSIQRQIRLLGKEDCEYLLNFTKILKIAISDTKKQKAQKIQSLAEKINKSHVSGFNPTRLIKLDDLFIERLSQSVPSTADN